MDKVKGLDVRSLPGTRLRRAQLGQMYMRAPLSPRLLPAALVTPQPPAEENGMFASAGQDTAEQSHTYSAAKLLATHPMVDQKKVGLATTMLIWQWPA